MEITIDLTRRDADLLDRLKQADGYTDLTYSEYAEALLTRYLHILAQQCRE